jgi:hypothetical protein
MYYRGRDMVLTHRDMASARATGTSSNLEHAIVPSVNAARWENINLTGDYVWKGGDRDGQTQPPTATGPQSDVLAYFFYNPRRDPE